MRLLDKKLKILKFKNIFKNCKTFKMRNNDLKYSIEYHYLNNLDEVSTLRKFIKKDKHPNK